MNSNINYDALTEDERKLVSTPDTASIIISECLGNQESYIEVFPHNIIRFNFDDMDVYDSFDDFLLDHSDHWVCFNSIRFGNGAEEIVVSDYLLAKIVNEFRSYLRYTMGPYDAAEALSNRLLILTQTGVREYSGVILYTSLDALNRGSIPVKYMD